MRSRGVCVAAVVAALATALVVSPSLWAAPEHGLVKLCGKLAGPTWVQAGNTGSNWKVWAWGNNARCSLALAYAKKFAGAKVAAAQLHANLAQPKYVLRGGPTGFTCYVMKSALDANGRSLGGTCSKGPLPTGPPPRYSAEMFEWTFAY